MTKALCLLCAGALALTAAGCSKSGASSSAASSEAVSVYGSASDYDYQNFAYSDGLDENGYWSGIKALDYVTLPEDYAAIPLKKADIEPTEEDIQSQIDSLLSQNTTTRQVTDRAAADGDTVGFQREFLGVHRYPPLRRGPPGDKGMSEPGRAQVSQAPPLGGFCL